MGLLKLDKKLNIVIDEHLLLIKEFRHLYDRDETSKKQSVILEFKYIYFLCDPSSIGVKRGYKDKKLHEEAIKNFEIDEDWIPDEHVVAAINVYRNDVNGVGTRLLISLLATFNTSDRLVKKLNKSIDSKLDGSDLLDEEIDVLLARLQKILDVGTKLPKQLDELKKAKELSVIEQETMKKGRGKGNITRSMETPS